ncbi:MAG: enoyl-CoA hydratase/isomerase family protein [Pseudomonadota bacterium]
MAKRNVQIRIQGQVGYLTLDRPDALHALNMDMCADMLSALRDWSASEDIRFVLLDHSDGTRGFCAGGDIRMLAESGAKDGQEAMAFFETEYRLNAAIFNFPKPFIAVMDGVTMGGGVGVSVHGSHRIATEKTLFAMPETGIGLFPDVGGGWFLPRLKGELGTWLALTGARLKGADVTAAGIATHYVPSERLAALKSELPATDLPTGSVDQLERIIAQFAEDVPDASFAPHLGVIDRCFCYDSAEDILEALKSDPSDWAREQADVLSTKSPRTIKVALRQVREGKRFEMFEDNMRNEYRIAWRQVRSPDFLEGVRAIIIDKDHDPKWNPATLDAVSNELIDQVFAPMPDGKELSF